MTSCGGSGRKGPSEWDVRVLNVFSRLLFLMVICLQITLTVLLFALTVSSVVMFYYL